LKKTWTPTLQLHLVPDARYSFSVSSCGCVFATRYPPPLWTTAGHCPGGHAGVQLLPRSPLGHKHRKQALVRELLSCFTLQLPEGFLNGELLLLLSVLLQALLVVTG